MQQPSCTVCASPAVHLDEDEDEIDKRKHLVALIKDYQSLKAFQDELGHALEVRREGLCEAPAESTSLLLQVQAMHEGNVRGERRLDEGTVW
jgi:hypothetical protein